MGKSLGRALSSEAGSTDQAEHVLHPSALALNSAALERMESERQLHLLLFPSQLASYWPLLLAASVSAAFWEMESTLLLGTMEML